MNDLVFTERIRTGIFCDASISCATSGRIIIYHIHKANHDADDEDDRQGKMEKGEKCSNFVIQDERAGIKPTHCARLQRRRAKK